jgi:hypothetical protein
MACLPGLSLPFSAPARSASGLKDSLSICRRPREFVDKFTDESKKDEVFNFIFIVSGE